jgi:hypothetical protein
LTLQILVRVSWNARLAMGNVSYARSTVPSDVTLPIESKPEE